jgi:hypothetical protein
MSCSLITVTQIQYKIATLRMGAEISSETKSCTSCTHSNNLIPPVRELCLYGVCPQGAMNESTGCSEILVLCNRLYGVTNSTPRTPLLFYKYESGRSLLLYQFTKRGDKADCNIRSYRRISLLSTSYEILSNILLSRLVPYMDEIIGDHQCGFRRNRSSTDQIFCIRRILEKKWEYNETVHQLFIDFKQAYDSD